MVNFVKVRVSWDYVDQPNIGGYVVYYDTTNHATDADIVANATKLEVGPATFAFIEGLVPATTYYWWVRWESFLGDGPFTASTSFTTGEELIVDNSGTPVIDETKFTNLKMPNVSGTAIPGLQPWPMGKVADTTALEAIPIASCNANAGLTVYVEDRARMYHWNPNATGGYTEPSDKTNPGVDPGYWTYAVDEDPEHYLVPINSLVSLKAIPYDSITANARVFVEEIDADVYWDAGALQGDYRPNDATLSYGYWKLSWPRLQRYTKAAASPPSPSIPNAEIGYMVMITDATGGPAICVWDGSNWINSRTGAQVN